MRIFILLSIMLASLMLAPNCSFAERTYPHQDRLVDETKQGNNIPDEPRKPGNDQFTGIKKGPKFADETKTNITPDNPQRPGMDQSTGFKEEPEPIFSKGLRTKPPAPKSESGPANPPGNNVPRSPKFADETKTNITPDNPQRPGMDQSTGFKEEPEPIFSKGMKATPPPPKWPGNSNDGDSSNAGPNEPGAAPNGPGTGNNTPNAGNPVGGPDGDQSGNFGDETGAFDIDKTDWDNRIDNKDDFEDRIPDVGAAGGNEKSPNSSPVGGP